MGETLAQRAAHVVMVAQQIARGENQIVEVEQGARAFVVAEALQDRTRFVDQRRQERGLRRPGASETQASQQAV